VYQDRIKGGLGIRDLQKMNDALVLKVGMAICKPEGQAVGSGNASKVLSEGRYMGGDGGCGSDPTMAQNGRIEGFFS
jgi:hypothetical protein